MRTYIGKAILCMAAAYAALSCSKENIIIPDAGGVENLEYITISLADQVKTAYEMDGNNLKTTWSAGDIVAVTPDLGLYAYAATYEVTDPGSSTAKFQLVTSMYQAAIKYGYGIFYPGDKVKGITDFGRFSYDGQVQKKSDPMGHIKDYHSMFKYVDSFSDNISFEGASQSACMRLRLSGMTFHEPVGIELSVQGHELFYSNNYMGNYPYYYFTSDSIPSLEKASKISITLDGYGDENSIEAWIMMSNQDVLLKKGDKLVVTVTQKDGTQYNAEVIVPSDMTLSGGKWHDLRVGKGWKEGSGSGSGSVPEYDGEVVVLQEGIPGLDLVIMGDGFIVEDFEDGTYDSIMRQCFEEFFSVEPFTTLRNDFHVAYVKAVSPERINATTTGANGAQNNGSRTKFSTQFEPNSTYVGGDNDMVREYAKKALDTDSDSRMRNVTIVVMANQECRAGTCHMTFYTSSNYDNAMSYSIAYCALGTSASERKELMRHEICGHGFGKLDDEYYYSQSYSNSDMETVWNNQEQYHSWGLYRNVDRYVNSSLYSYFNGKYPLTNESNVYWSDLFGTANNYESADVESLGVFEGAQTVKTGFCRPTEDGSESIMNNNTGIFNAISRRSIYYRYLHLSGQISGKQYGTSEELNRFLDWDAQYILPKLKQNSAQASHQARERIDHVLYNLDEPMPLHRPVLRFVEDDE